MKITEKPIEPPPPVVYVLELSFEQLVTLGVWSHRHEIRNGQGSTFYDLLPDAVREEANRRATTLNIAQPGRPLGGGYSLTTVDWGQ